MIRMVEVRMAATRYAFLLNFSPQAKMFMRSTCININPGL